MASLREVREGFLKEGVNSIFQMRTCQVQNDLLKQRRPQQMEGSVWAASRRQGKQEALWL